MALLLSSASTPLQTQPHLQSFNIHAVRLSAGRARAASVCRETHAATPGAFASARQVQRRKEKRGLIRSALLDLSLPNTHSQIHWGEQWELYSSGSCQSECLHVLSSIRRLRRVIMLTCTPPPAPLIRPVMTSDRWAFTLAAAALITL